jgi:hypothetical protein
MCSSSLFTFFAGETNEIDPFCRVITAKLLDWAKKECAPAYALGLLPWVLIKFYQVTQSSLRFNLIYLSLGLS